MSDRGVLEAFGGALDREAHNLSRWPELTWQQLYNRLNGSTEPLQRVLELELRRRTGAGTVPWLRLKEPLPESRSLLRTLAGHHDRVGSCAISPDGSFIVSASADRMLKVWDVASGQELSTIAANASGEDCAISADATLLACTSGYDIGIWDLASGERRGDLKGHSYGTRSCAFSPDGSFVASAGNHTLRIWNAATARGQCILRGNIGLVQECAISPDCSFVVSAGEWKRLEIWDIPTGKKHVTLEGHSGPVLACEVSPDGRFVISAGGRLWWHGPAEGNGGDNTLKLWDAMSGRQVATLEGHMEGTQACAVSPDGQFIVSAGADGTLKIWDPASRDEAVTLDGHTGMVHDCVISPDGSLIVSASEDRTLKIWDAHARSANTSPRAHAGSVETCGFSPDGRLIVSAGFADETLKLADLRAGKELWSVNVGSIVYDCAISPDGEWLVAATNDRTLIVAETKTGTVLGSFSGHTSPVTTCAISPDGKVVASGDRSASLRVWDVESGVERQRFEPRTWVNSCALSPDGRYVVAALGRLMGVQKPEILMIFPIGSSESEGVILEGHLGVINECAVSPDWRFIVSASDDKTLGVWETSSGRRRTALLGHTDSVEGCAVTPDGSFIVSSSTDGTLRIWDTTSEQAVATLPLLGALRCVALHPWLPVAVCGDQGGHLYVGDLISIEYGPIVVTAVERGDEPMLRCPKCWQEHLLDDSSLGEVICCPTPDCDLLLRVNPFVARNPFRARE